MHVSEYPSLCCHFTHVFLGQDPAVLRQRALRQHSFFQLHVHLKRGQDLVARDACGKLLPQYSSYQSGETTRAGSDQPCVCAVLLLYDLTSQRAPQTTSAAWMSSHPNTPGAHFPLFWCPNLPDTRATLSPPSSQTSLELHLKVLLLTRTQTIS